MSEISQANRRFETFLFGSVPETVTSTYQRDSFGNAENLQTGLPLNQQHKCEIDDYIYTSKYSYQPELRRGKFFPASSEP